MIREPIRGGFRFSVFGCRQLSTTVRQTAREGASAGTHQPSHLPGFRRTGEWPPEVWLDINVSERALRASILRRKKHYGSKSKRGMKAAAVFYSLVETCQLIAVNPRVYLREAL